MAFRSKAQRRKFYVMAARKEISQATVDEWERETPEDLPERVKKRASAGQPRRGSHTKRWISRHWGHR